MFVPPLLLRGLFSQPQFGSIYPTVTCDGAHHCLYLCRLEQMWTTQHFPETRVDRVSGLGMTSSSAAQLRETAKHGKTPAGGRESGAGGSGCERYCHPLRFKRAAGLSQGVGVASNREGKLGST